MSKRDLTVTRLDDLRAGDRIVGLDDIRYARALLVSEPLDYVVPGSPVQGVRIDSAGRSFEHVLYPSQWNGRTIHVQREAQ